MQNDNIATHVCKLACNIAMPNPIGEFCHSITTRELSTRARDKPLAECRRTPPPWTTTLLRTKERGRRSRPSMPLRRRGHRIRCQPAARWRLTQRRVGVAVASHCRCGRACRFKDCLSSSPPPTSSRLAARRRGRAGRQRSNCGCGGGSRGSASAAW